MKDCSFAAISRLFERIGEGRDKGSVVDELVSFLRRVDRSSAINAIRILRGDFGEASKPIGTHLMRRIVSEALANVTPMKHSEIEELMERGELRKVISSRGTRLIQGSLSIDETYRGMLDVCAISGKGSIGYKAKSLVRLLNKASDEDAYLIIKILLGEHPKMDDELILRAVGKVAYGSEEKLIGTNWHSIPGSIYRAVERALGESGFG
ncbi:MAG: hypothetical protein ACUVQY_04190 [Thermoproteota archaeon]